MLLCIDTGNTNTLFSIWDGERFLSHWRIATDHRRTADEYFVWLRSLMSLSKLDVAVDGSQLELTSEGPVAPEAEADARSASGSGSGSGDDDDVIEAELMDE